ncbi:hypothetical protein [Acetobacterium bakii]|uniref:Uncharacterized protein n=1 Tax=Acetobacterium bakii TaxID=52689 RepID=A0A0L6U1Y2_9FIRM|nr:hypothetical protein [Acetobacterium bakii]KNZ42523.1 hypothetical protein AKG39_06275 [Acetobacterium bakii]
MEFRTDIAELSSLQIFMYFHPKGEPSIAALEVISAGLPLISSYVDGIKIILIWRNRMLLNAFSIAMYKLVDDTEL